MAQFLHDHPNFRDLLHILADETGIQAGLIEKDYWIMHVLYGLKSQGFEFELKGGTSLSKGFKIIERFSEDIDIHIKPPVGQHVNENPKNIKQASVEGRKRFYDWLAENIKIKGIEQVERDIAFDNIRSYSSGGIRLFYNNLVDQIVGIKAGILLEAGFDQIMPNEKVTISSWAYERAIQQGVAIIDNRAIDMLCYHPGYTFVEKLQTIATKFRKEQESGKATVNFMRQYYDIYSLLGNTEVVKFITTPEYLAHKQSRFPAADLEIPISQNEAFLLTDIKTRELFRKRYRNTSALYYNGQPEFETLLARIHRFIDKL